MWQLRQERITLGDLTEIQDYWIKLNDSKKGKVIPFVIPEAGIAVDSVSEGGSIAAG
ncbi:MAG: hypothetical protein ACLVD8_27400 [Enterocloster sp.]|uniref:hypothetical protein n=1 Tax=Enterocloster sp. TaxID=2719315 RepID=UPI00399B3357